MPMILPPNSVSRSLNLPNMIRTLALRRAARKTSAANRIGGTVAADAARISFIDTMERIGRARDSV
jgi:hypothetical protein